MEYCKETLYFVIFQGGGGGGGSAVPLTSSPLDPRMHVPTNHDFVISVLISYYGPIYEMLAPNKRPYRHIQRG